MKTHLSLAIGVCACALLFAACAAGSRGSPSGEAAAGSGGSSGTGGDPIYTAGMPPGGGSGGWGGGAATGGSPWGGTGGDTGGAGTSGAGTGGAGTGGSSGGSPWGGTGGGTGGAGTGGAGGSAGTPATGETLVTANGWIDGGSNSYAIQGAWYTYCDSCDSSKPIGTSSISPSGDGAYSSASGSICASGSAGVVLPIEGSSPPEYDWSGPTWGSGIGLNIGQKEGDTTPYGYANSQGIKGFSVTLSGTVDGGTIRIKYVVFGNESTDYCKELSVPGTHSVPFTDTTASCWQGGGASPSPTSIAAVQFQVVSNETAAKSFDFCVESISVLP